MRRYIVMIISALMVGYIVGQYRETRTDSYGSWCIHFQHALVCNQAFTDYTLNAE